MPALFFQFQSQKSSVSIPIQLPGQVLDLEDSIFDTQSLFSSSAASDFTDDDLTLYVGESIPGPSSRASDSDSSPSLSQRMPGASPPLKRQKAMLFVSFLFNFHYKV